MPFNPSSFTDTQNAGPKPKVIVHDWLSNTGAGLMSGAYTSLFAASVANPTPPAPVSVVEGQSAVASFWFVDPANTDPYQVNDLVELKDSATFNLSWDGTSSADVGAFEYSTYNGTIWSGWSAVPSGGNISLADPTPTNPNSGTGVYAVAVQLAIKTDTLVENGEHVLFKFTQSSSTKFTDSNYVEAKINIADFVAPAVTVAGGTTNATANQDVFAVTGTVGSFGTIGNGTPGNIFGAGDKLRVDIANTTSPGLSMVNFGVLTGVAGSGEPSLINGLQALNGLDCNTGGLYIMGVGSDTYIIFDSTNNGKLDTDGTPTDDVFVKLAGVNPHSLQSTHFDLV